MKQENDPLKVREQALAQLRLTEAKIMATHPELLGSVRTRLFDAAGDSGLAVDRKKNLEAVMGMMEIRGDSSAGFKQQIQQVLIECDLSS